MWLTDWAIDEDLNAPNKCNNMSEMTSFGSSEAFDIGFNLNVCVWWRKATVPRSTGEALFDESCRVEGPNWGTIQKLAR